MSGEWLRWRSSPSWFHWLERGVIDFAAAFDKAAVDQRRSDLRLGHKLRFDVSFAAQPYVARAQFQDRKFQAQLVAGNDGPAKFGMIDAGEKDQLRFAVRQ